MRKPANLNRTNQLDEGDDFPHATIDLGDHGEAVIVYAADEAELAKRVQIIIAAFYRDAQIEDSKKREAEEFAILF